MKIYKKNASEPVLSIEKNEILITILFELVSAFPYLKELISTSIEIDFICILFKRYKLVSALKFVSIIIDDDEIFHYEFKPMIDLLITDYEFLSKISKDYERLFVINCATVKMEVKEIYIIVNFLEQFKEENQDWLK